MGLFDEYTEDHIKELILDKAPQGIDTREGSIYYDAIAGVADIMARLFSDATLISNQSSIVTATGECLDILAEQLYLSNDIRREQAVKALYRISLNTTSGVTIDHLDLDDGDRFIVNELYFKYRVTDDGIYLLEAEEAGAEYNGLFNERAVPVETIDYLESVVLEELLQPGIDEETDDEFRQRLMELLSAPAENANSQNYKTWCENVKGVGSATIFPLFAGPNTVKAVLTDSNNKPCSPDIVKAVQDYIDPITRNTKVVVDGQEIVVGDGIGDGKAPLGAHFLAVSATNYSISVSLILVVSDDVDSTKIASDIKDNIDSYFSSLVKNYDARNKILVKYNQISSIVANTKGVDDFSAFTINGETLNIQVPEGQIPFIEGVELID